MLSEQAKWSAQVHGGNIWKCIFFQLEGFMFISYVISSFWIVSCHKSNINKWVHCRLLKAYEHWYSINNLIFI